MQFFLLAVETLAVTWLLMALAVACAARRGAAIRWLSALVVAVLCLAFYGWLILGIYHEEYVEETTKIGLMRPLGVLAVLYFVGAAIVVRRGFRRTATVNDDAAAGSAPPPRACQWPRGRIALGLVASVVLTVMTVVALDAVARVRVDQMCSQATALALAVAPRPVADEDNAAVLYRELTPTFEPLYKNAWYEVWVGHDGPDEPFDYRSAEANAFMEARRGQIELLRRAGAMRHCVYDRSYDSANTFRVIDDLRPMRDAARLLSAHALWSGANGDMKSALADVTAMSQLAHHAARDVDGTMLLTGLAIDGVAFDTLQRVLRSESPSSEALAAADVQPWFSYQRQLPRIFRSDEAAFLNSMAEFDSAAVGLFAQVPQLSPASADFSFAAISWLRLGPLYRILLLVPEAEAFRQDMLPVNNSASLSYDAYKKSCRRLEPELEGDGLASGGAKTLLMCVEPTYRGDAKIALAHTALAMHRYRAEHSKFPDALSDLTPEILAIVPRDPYSDQPLRLKQTDEGWVVYSIGPDATDDQGQPWDYKDERGDFTFEYVAPREEQE